ncbi:MAG: GxxExxY protein [Acidobacteriota bacterium]
MNRIEAKINCSKLNRKGFLHENLTRQIIGHSYEVMNELGRGFLESVYHKAFEVALRSGGLIVESEVSLKVSFRGHNVGNFRADLIVEQKVMVEVKVAEAIVGEHKAQVINYLCASNLLVGLIVNFGQAKIQTARLHHPSIVRRLET